eukprot:2356976-Prorocentrum_lima.AAC.1
MSWMKWAHMEIYMVLNAALGPDLTNVIAAESSLSTLVRGAAWIPPPKQRSKVVPCRTPATIPT